MFQMAKRVSGGVLWANLHLLFWLSLYPFTTGWMDETGFERTPVVVYGVNLLAAAVAYYVLQTLIIRAEGPDSGMKEAIGTDLKGKLSPALYAAGIASAAWLGADVGVPLAMGFFVAVAIIWLVPDKRLERAIVAVEARNG